jgi:hypothetical protein
MDTSIIFRGILAWVLTRKPKLRKYSCWGGVTAFRLSVFAPFPRPWVYEGQGFLSSEFVHVSTLGNLLIVHDTSHYFYLLVCSLITKCLIPFLFSRPWVYLQTGGLKVFCQVNVSTFHPLLSNDTPLWSQLCHTEHFIFPLRVFFVLHFFPFQTRLRLRVTSVCILCLLFQKSNECSAVCVFPHSRTWVYKGEGFSVECICPPFHFRKFTYHEWHKYLFFPLPLTAAN